MEFKDAMKQRRAVNFFDPTKDVTDAQLKGNNRNRFAGAFGV